MTEYSRSRNDIGDKLGQPATLDKKSIVRKGKDQHIQATRKGKQKKQTARSNA
jgi:hypothetical protein